MAIDLRPGTVDSRPFGTIGADNINSPNDNLSLMSGWYATDIVTMSANVNLDSTYADGSGLYCRAVEDVEATGKKVQYYEWWQATDGTPRYHNGATGAFSGIQPIIRELVYDSSQATTVKLYFQKLSGFDISNR